jgi:hypothetical protein
MDELLGKIPGAATAKNAADALKAMYSLPDEARTGTALDHMDIDDDVALIVDDPIENDFLNKLADELENMDDNAPMSNLNVTKGLANYLEKKFNARTVSGFNEGRHMKITKRQLRRIIREEQARLLREQEEVKADNNTHHWPRVDWTNVEELVDKWAQGERDAFDKGDPVMMGMGETYNEAKGIWDMQVERAGMDMENELINRVRQVALKTMKEFTDKLIEGEYA